MELLSIGGQEVHKRSGIVRVFKPPIKNDLPSAYNLGMKKPAIAGYQNRLPNIQHIS